MNINRRQLLKIISQVGVASALGVNVESDLFAAPTNYNGPLWIMVNAKGGWDVTSLCDPKGYNSATDKTNPERLNNYDAAEIQQAGNIRFAPSPDSFRPGNLNYDPNLYTANTFFNKYFRELFIVNGLDCQTNSHKNGQLHNFAGRLRQGYPAFAALVSAALAPNAPLSFLSNGGYTHAADLITPVRMNNTALRSLYEIAYPNRSSNPAAADSRIYLPTEVESLISQASNDRLLRLKQQQNLPRILRSITDLIDARSEAQLLQGLADDLATNVARPESDFNGRKNAYHIYQQGRVALAGYQQGVTSTVNIHLSGFDTHANHDKKHHPLLMDLLQGVDSIIDEAQSRGLGDRIVVVMLSDFGRTNKYNKDSGKDHWPIGSAMLMGNSAQIIRGNRVVGQTDQQHKAYAVDPSTLQPDISGNAPATIKITPQHIHVALRQLAEVDSSPGAIAYGLTAENLNLFS